MAATAKIRRHPANDTDRCGLVYIWRLRLVYYFKFGKWCPLSCSDNISKEILRLREQFTIKLDRSGHKYHSSLYPSSFGQFCNFLSHSCVIWQVPSARAFSKLVSSLTSLVHYLLHGIGTSIRRTWGHIKHPERSITIYQQKHLLTIAFVRREFPLVVRIVIQLRTKRSL